MCNLHQARQRMLSMPCPDAVFELPTDTTKEWCIGDVATGLGVYTGRLQAAGLIRRVGRGMTKGNRQRAIIWSSTPKYLEYREKYYEED